MMKLKTLSLAIAAASTALLALSANAADPKLAVVYGGGGKFDKSFNQSAYEGAERFKKATKIGYLEAQVTTDAQGEQVLRQMARKDVDLVVAIGFTLAKAVETVSKEFPKVKFMIVDSVVPGDNVSSVTFKEQEGSYLVGVAAALATKTQKVGFVGGMDVPLIRAFGCGYAQGVKAVDSKIEVTQNMVAPRLPPGATPPKVASWPARRWTAALTSFLPLLAAVAWARCRQSKIKTSSASALTPTRTRCTPVLSSRRCSSVWTTRCLTALPASRTAPGRQA